MPMTRLSINKRIDNRSGCAGADPACGVSRLRQS